MRRKRSGKGIPMGIVILLAALLLQGCGKGNAATETKAKFERKDNASEAVEAAEAAEADAEQDAENQEAASEGEKPEEKESADASAGQAETQVQADGENQLYDPVTEYQMLYRDVLEQLYQTAIGNGEAFYDIGGGTGVMEIVNRDWAEDVPVLKRVGYVYQDLNGDQAPELLIVENERPSAEDAGGSHVLACYTLENGQPSLVFEGWNRNRFAYAGGNRFYHWASGGASESLEGKYHISEDGRKLEAERVYFVSLTTENGQMVPAFYTNTSGEWDPKASEKLDISEEEFAALTENWTFDTEFLPLSTFWELAERETFVETEQALTDAITISWALEGDLNSDAAMTYAYGNEEDIRDSILITTNGVYKEFRLMRLTMLDMDREYHLIYEAERLYGSDYFIEEIPFVATLVFPGDTPSYGISCYDTEGKRHAYAIGISGMDGQPYFIPLDVTEDSR